ncbi:MAG: DNA mismatch repair endonuclease MutL [Deltaproteobacteria bacterium]|jgi:DNA mismatch repair protein MutL|nr:DNA mismatch repair endonuclease MutL [Deltaproteobacteria bacterium]
MTTVKILPEILSNQIAAGEVVQRPSSVVKELVENSIDAGSKSITIEIVKGGKSLIRVSDDGCGLARDDALLSIERYATSKIFKKEDLFSISTMGFRGEALPSIASISKFCLVTRRKDSDIGTRIEIVGGKIRDVSDAGAPVGTMVEVKNLFFNTPARKKFLKTDNTETSHVIDAISGMALGNPGVQIRLFLNNRLHKSFSSSDDLFARSVNVLGKDTADKLYKLDFMSSALHIHGLCSNPSVTRSTSSKIFLFVNNRLVYDRGLISAIFRGYRQRIMKGRFPLGVFFIDIDFDQVDVNVHPSKREIKFFSAQKVYESVSQTIENRLSREQQNVTAYSNIKTIPEEKFEYIDNALKFDPSATDHTEFDQRGLVRTELEQTSRVEQPVTDWQSTFEPDVSSSALQTHISAPHPPSPLTTNPLQLKAHNSNLTTQISNLTIIGQAMGTYIIAESQNTLMFIDQHAAHERIVYEKLKKRYKTLNVQSQNLLAPETLELNFKETDLLLEILDDLNALGMMIEPFGDTTFVIKAVPSIIDEKEVKPIILDIIETALNKKDKFSKEAWLDKCLISMACHGAVRANSSLNQKEITQLLIDLEKCENSRHCPHGRPIIAAWTKNQMEKLFKRVL